MINSIKYLLQLLLFITVLGTSSSINAQTRVLPSDSGYIFTFISPSEEYRVKINGVLQEQGNRFALKRGEYSLSIWAPHHEVWDTTVTLNAKRLRIARALSPKQEFIEYQQNLEKFSSYKGKGIVGGISTVLLSTAAIFNYNRIGDLNFDYTKAKNGNKYGFEGFNQQVENDAEKDLKNAQTLQYVVYGAMAASAAYSIYNFIKMKKLGLPKLKEDNGFVVDGIGIGVNRFNTPQFYTTISF